MATNENKCCKIETWALVYGIFNIIISVVGIVLASVFISQNSHGNEAMFNIFAYILMFPEILLLPFSIILVYGVCKKSRALVLTYFIFGIIFSLFVIAAFIYLTINLPSAGVICLVIFLIIFVLPLYVVFLTFMKLQPDRGYHYSNKLNLRTRAGDEDNAVA